MRFKTFINESASDVTRKQESLFAAGFAIYQLKGGLTEDMLMDGDIFAEAYNRYVESDASVNEVFDFGLNASQYRNSVVMSVNKLMSSSFKPLPNSTVYRGASLMNNIYTQAQILIHKEGKKITADKWNPGDVWISKLSSIPVFDSIDDLNMFVKKGIKSKKLIPVSLKKTKSPSIEYINQSDEIEFPSFAGIKKPKGPFNVGVVLETTGNLKLDVRSFRQSAAASISTEILETGGTARHGKSTPSSFIKKYNIHQTSLSDIRRMVKDVDEGIIKQNVLLMWKSIGYTFSTQQIEKSWIERVNNKDYIKNSAGYWRSIINSLEFASFLLNHREISDDIVKGLFKKAMSRSKLSSDFIKIK